MENLWLSLILAAALAAPARSATFVTADADLRYSSPPSHGRLEAAGLAVRQVFADREGDRLTAFVLAEALDDFREKGLDQAYLRYKGPLGSWNLTAGRYVLPFGLLPNFSSRRLLIPTMEAETVGLETDNGAMISGLAGDFDYAVSFSGGTGMSQWNDDDRDTLVSARVGLEGTSDENPSAGISLAWGRPNAGHGMETGMDHASRPFRRIAAADLTLTSGLGTMRAEAGGGTLNDVGFGTVYAGYDRTIVNGLEANTAVGARVDRMETRGSAWLGATLGLPYTRLRLAWRQPLNNKEEKGELTLQAYLSISGVY